jgi:hypothetical protein
MVAGFVVSVCFVSLPMSYTHLMHKHEWVEEWVAWAGVAIMVCLLIAAGARATWLWRQRARACFRVILK